MNLMLSTGTGRNLWSSGFWSSLITIHASGWFFLTAASLRLPYSWQDRAASVARTRWRERISRWAHGSPASRALFRRALLDVNAFFWLAGRNRFKPWAVWLVFAATGLFWLWGWVKWKSSFTDEWVVVLFVLWLHTVLKMWMASESCQRVAEDRQSGALELLLSTPLSVRDILRGQWLALRRQFLWPTVCVVVLDVFLVYRLSSGRHDNWFYLGAAGIIVLVADMITLAWLGVWRSLRTRNASKAMAGSIGRVLILPWVLYFVCLQIIGILGLRVVFFRWGDKGELALWVALSLLFDAWFLFGSRWRLLKQFRELATQRADAKTHRWWWPFGRGTKSPPLPGPGAR
jgi:hypothetical protein